MKDSAELIANVTHELRSPIAIIQGYAETLQEHTLPPEQIQEIAGKIAGAALRLEKIVQSLLRLEDLESGSDTPLSLVDLEPLVVRCKQQVLTKYPEAKIAIQSDGAKICADPDLLELAVINLLENGIKYSEPPAQINVSISQKNRAAILCFQDQGIGIPHESLPYVFDRFYCVNKQRSRKFGGAGLGLSLVRAIVEKHRGSISVTSTSSQGSLFTIALPID